jgi:hypothetical protein
MTSLSLADMNVQFRTLTFHSRPEEQLQDPLHLKKFAILLSAMTVVLDSPLGPHPESDLATDLYFDSTLIAITGESNHWISSNRLKKFMTSLPTVIGILGSPLGPHPKSDIATDLYSNSTPIANMDESDRQVDFNRTNKSVISLSAVIGALVSPLEPRPERDLTTNLYSGSTLVVIKDESDRRISFRRL